MPPKSRPTAAASAHLASKPPSSTPSTALRTRPMQLSRVSGSSPSTTSASSSRAAAVAKPSRDVRTAHYGDIIASDEVHDEIRALGSEVKSQIAQHLPRHGTSEAQVMWGVRQFGPSKESRRVLNKENEAARLACETGVYCVWRCVEPPRLQGANNDFCCRLGYRHVCFCGHPMAAHTTPPRAANAQAAAPPPPSPSSSSPQQPRSTVSDRQLAQWKAPCEEAGCGCAAFRYIPNTPLEIGEAWLTRRANFKASEWSAKCRCGHGHKEHQPSPGALLRCRVCGGCSGFTSAFLCVVCDLPWEAHETVWESEGVRIGAGLPVREAYAPLSDVNWDIREAVLRDVTLGGRIEPSASYVALQERSAAAPSRSPRRQLASSPGSGPVAEAREERTGRAGADTTRASATTAAAVVDPVLDVEYCPACATIYRSAASKFCSKCGQPRPRRPTTLR